MFVRNLLRNSIVRPVAARNFVVLRNDPYLYGHLVKSDPRVRLSLSKDPNAVFIGTIPEECVSTYKEQLSALKDKINFDNTNSSTVNDQIRILNTKDFLPSDKFLDVAHTVIKSNIHNCPIFSQLAAAEQEDSLYFHIYDLRAPPPFGRIPEVEDIVGTVRLENGKISLDSYEPNLMYRTLTPNGIFTVSDYLNEKIRDECERAKEATTS